MWLWRRLAPPAGRSKFDDLGRDALIKRNGKLDGMFTALMFVGLISPVLVASRLLSGHPKSLFFIGLVALSFGLMVALPVAVVALLTLRRGADRFREFWRFYEIRWGIGLRGIAWVYIPIGLLAPLGLVLMLVGS
jgi:hypothetical protein